MPSLETSQLTASTPMSGLSAARGMGMRTVEGVRIGLEVLGVLLGRHLRLEACGDVNQVRPVVIDDARLCIALSGISWPGGRGGAHLGRQG